MNRVAIAFSTCDRTELTKRSIESLLQPRKFDLHWIDGSKAKEGQQLPGQYRFRQFHPQILGGSGPAIVYALSTLLKLRYEYIGLVENDVLLKDGWFEDMMALFERGKEGGLEVGAVSARAYEDRILIQRDGYAVMHNIGAGMIMFSRKAAQLVLQNYRTVWTTENRLLFAQLSGIDIASYWAFRGNEHFLVADWNFDRVLAANGLASLALTPNRCEMLDQDIAPLGLKYAGDNRATNSISFATYRDNLARIREGAFRPGVNHPFFHDASGYTIFPHQIPQIGGEYMGDWRIRDFLGFGPFCWKTGETGYVRTGSTQEYRPKLIALNVPVSGPCDFIVSGGEHGGKIKLEDEQSGYSVEPDLPAEAGNNFMQLSIPSSASYRNVRLTALSPGVCFLGLKTREPQPWLPNVKFDYWTLPPA